MVKHTQTIRGQQPTNYLSVFDHFVRLALKGLSKTYKNIQNLNNSSLQFTVVLQTRYSEKIL